jgi:hypothetical protein
MQSVHSTSHKKARRSSAVPCIDAKSMICKSPAATAMWSITARTATRSKADTAAPLLLLLLLFCCHPCHFGFMAHLVFCRRTGHVSTCPLLSAAWCTLDQHLQKAHKLGDGR